MESYLAQVVKSAPCCGWNSGVGIVVDVVHIKPAGTDAYCTKCKTKTPPGELLATVRKRGKIHLCRLKRLPPPSEVEQYDRELEIELPKVTA